MPARSVLNRGTARLLLWAYRLLLLLYPAAFRLRFGVEMAQAVRDRLCEPESNWGRLTLSLLVDTLWAAMKERTKMLNRRSVALLLAAAAAGAAIGWVDLRPRWDDTGITAAALTLAAAVCGAIAPRRPWMWALAVGVWVPIFAAMTRPNGGAVLALLFSFVGAYVGAIS